MEEQRKTEGRSREAQGSDNKERGEGGFRKKSFGWKSNSFWKKECHFKKNGIRDIDYRDTELLRRFVGRNGRILSRRITGTSHRYQRKLSEAVKRARYMALLPYTGEMRYLGPSRRQQQRQATERQSGGSGFRGDYNNKPSYSSNRYENRRETPSSTGTTGSEVQSSTTHKNEGTS